MDRHGPISLTFICAVFDRARKEKVIAMVEGKKAFFNLMMLGKGTASSKILGYLGLGETEKAVFFSVLPTELAAEKLQKLDAALQFKTPGHGIAFTAPIHEGCYHKLVHLAPDQTGGETVEHSNTHDLIMVILDRGYTEEVMDVARGAGANGGTVLHARGFGMAGAEKFFGITIQPEKELLMIVADVASSCGIMQAIADKAGPGTDVNAVSFSMPVSNVKGISSDVPDSVL